AGHLPLHPHRHHYRRGPGHGRDGTAPAHRHERLRRLGAGHAHRAGHRPARTDLSLAGQREPQFLRATHLRRHHGAARLHDHAERHRDLPALPPRKARLRSMMKMDMLAGKVKMTDQTLSANLDPADMIDHPIRLTARDVTVHYGAKHALHGSPIDIPGGAVPAFIGPSGCGKSTFLRCINRMNDTIEGARVGGRIELDGQDIYAPDLDVVELRARVGMVFQKPNPFPKSIYDNVAYGPRIHGLARNKADLDEIVVSSLRKAGLFEEVKDRLNEPGTGLSGGQQQRLCIARAIAVGPEVIL